MRSLSLKSLGCVAAVLAAMQMGCSDQSGQSPKGSGGSSGTGGKTSSGGTGGTGGSVASTGGSGGAVSTGDTSTGGSGGGATTTDGTGGTGGKGSNTPDAGGGKAGSDGGTTTTGNKDAAADGPRGPGGADGGSTSTGETGGGAAGNGGGPGVASSEDPSADCTVGPMPAVSSLKANPKLPDPFKKMDGTAMTTKKEWHCRREEILQQGYEFMYGKKPRTPASAVDGTVSSSNISVSVKDGGSGSFKATVTVPKSGKAPYPAVITYSSVSATDQFTSNGVAVINYDPYSVGSEQTKGTGAFYSVYGKDHEAGLLTAWAWGVSRIIDVIEKNPGTIDPTKLAVTGCSRFGKGALVAGAFDARVALTIPMESGVGGTPALRLIGQLDSYSGSEWPYHAISYEPWFSPTKLGQFTTANDDAGDNTDKLPVDTHEMIALIVPRGLYIWDNPSTNYNGLDRNSAYVTGSIAMKLFEALGAKDNITYQGASGSHCQWRDAYKAPLIANIQKFLLGDSSAKTGTFATELGGTKPNPDSYMDFTIPTLSGDLE